MKQKLSFTYLLLTLSGIFLLGLVLSTTPFETNNNVFSQMEMTGKDMIKNGSTATQTGQQMKGMDMGQQMKGMDMGQQMKGMDMGQQMKGMDMAEMMKTMPPHYSKSTYHLISSVKGMQISGLDIVNDKELLVKIKSDSSDPVNQTLTLVGGGGDLAGSVSVKAGWKENSEVNLKLQGSGSLFNLEGVHLHLFP